MKRILTIGFVAAALFGLTACSGESEPTTETTPTEEVAGTAPETGEPATTAEPTEIDAETLQSCLDFAGPMQEASVAMLEKLSDGKTPPQEVVDMYTDLAQALGKISDNASNAEVKEKANAAHLDFVALRDAMQKVYVEGDYSAMGDFASASSAIQESYSELLELCSPE